MTAARIRPTVRGGDQVGITIPRVAELHNVTYPPAKNAIKTLVELGALREMARTFSYGAKGFICDPVMRVLNRP